MEEEKTEQKEEEKIGENIVHNFEESTPFFTKNLIIILVVVFLFGIGSGYLLSQRGGAITGTTQTVDKGSIKKGTIEGAKDMSAFKDIAEGTLKKGGIDGEGAYHLERPGGPSQYVYLTSSIIDLSKYIDKKIKVWGETQKAQKAGWLMDVGKVEVL